MNRNKLKTYAPQARREFIEAVKDRAAHYGLTAKKIEQVTEQGDVVLIAGRPFPKEVGKKRKKLEDCIKRMGFGQMIEAMAYTWFNRLVAIRFVELHGYLEHGYRVLSAAGSGQKAEGSQETRTANRPLPTAYSTPEILDQAQHVDLPGLDPQQVIDLKLEGTNQANETLYRLLLIAQCNALHKALPFLFESIDDETELLLPDNLLHSDSLIRNLVGEIPEEDWQEVEIIGWLYQFYISEKKDEVIGKVVKTEDIPAATQLFTPNWIVKYLVQNSLGRQWMATYPNSPLKAKMEYYIEPAEQTEEVQAKLAEITPTSLNPEELTLLDPACGSGHILVEAYELLKAIYQERGYRAKDIPRMILTQNLYGLEIDDRAAQLAAFALMMKARADDRRIFAEHVQPHVLSIQESKGLDAREITEALNEPILTDKQPPSGELSEEIADETSPLFRRKNLSKAGDVSQADVAHLIGLFEHAKTFGSLIQIPEKLAEKLPAIAQRVDDVIAHGGMFEQGAAREFKQLVEQARYLASQHDAVVMNPPYMGARSGMNSLLKSFVNELYPNTKSDLYAMFIERGLNLAKMQGCNAMVAMHGWMFLTSYERMREDVLANGTIRSLAHLGARAFGAISGEVVQVAAFSMTRGHISGYRPSFLRLVDGEEESKGVALKTRANLICDVIQDDFQAIPGSPIAYWAIAPIRQAFSTSTLLIELAAAKQGMATSNNDRFLRFWHEVALDNICFGCANAEESSQRPEKWYPYNKGGTFRRWYGNNEYVVNWKHNGSELRAFVDEINRLRPGGRLKNQEYYFRTSITYSALSSGLFGCRYNEPGFLFDTKGSCIFTSDERISQLLGYLNSVVAQQFLDILCPTLDYSSIGITRLPVQLSEVSKDVVWRLVALAKDDWDELEDSWDFRRLRLISQDGESNTVKASMAQWNDLCGKRRLEMIALEKRNNEVAIETFGLQDELSPEVHEDEITLYRPEREEDITRLISYAIGCMMGRYSLDKPGLIYAHSGGKGFDPSQYQTFPADEDGIVPLTELEWFEDDAAQRFVKFIATTWPKEHLEENLKFVGESLGQKRGESPRDTIRRYLAFDFYKHHLLMYKKRPIYWLFSSGKQRGFQALAYLHRYNEGTLARMRTQYVIPLIGKMTARIDHLTEDIAQSSSSQQSKRLEKEKTLVTKQLAEVQAFEEKLRHRADQRIKLDLDDGVKVNYGKFGDLLAEVKAVTGWKAEP